MKIDDPLNEENNLLTVNTDILMVYMVYPIYHNFCGSHDNSFYDR